MTSSHQVDVLDTGTRTTTTIQVGLLPLFSFLPWRDLSLSSLVAGIHTPELTRAFPRYNTECVFMVK
jgi:hypothetical protein